MSTVPSTTTSMRCTGPCTDMVLTRSPAPSVKRAPNSAPSAETAQPTTACAAVEAGVSRWLWVTKRIGVSKE